MTPDEVARISGNARSPKVLQEKLLRAEYFFAIIAPCLTTLEVYEA